MTSQVDARTAPASRLFDLSGRVALVTGASGGIGFAVAQMLGGAGATLALSASSQGRLDQAASQLDVGSVEAFTADLGEPAQAESLVARVADRFGRLDILINCAGINKREPALELSVNDYDRVLAVNLRAPFLLARCAATHMIEAGGGRIVNVGSLTTEVALGGTSAYGMSKAALGQMTRQLALEWAKYDILVNCVLPGFLRTSLTAAVWDDPRRRQWMLDHIPLGRGGHCDEVATVVLFLASPASSYVTGTCLPVDGGVLAGLPGYESGG